VWGPTKGFQSYEPLWNSYKSTKEKGCVSNLFHNFQVIPMKLATSNPHEESTFSTYFVWGLTQRFQSYAPFSKLLHVHIEKVSQSSSIVSKSSTWFSFMFWHPNQFFKTVICNLQQDFELFGNGLWVFQNSLNPGVLRGPLDPWPRLCPGPTVGLAAPWPPASFSGFQLWAAFTPVLEKLNDYVESN